MYLPWNSQWFFKVAFSVDAVRFFVYLLIFFGIILHNSFYYSLCMLKIMKIWFSPVVRNSSKNWHSSQSSNHTQICDHSVYVSLLLVWVGWALRSTDCLMSIVIYATVTVVVRVTTFVTTILYIWYFKNAS